MKTLLINPPVRVAIKADIIPWGLAYIAQSIADEGHGVEILDVNAYRWEKDEVLNKISELDFDLIGIGGLITTYSYLKWITLELKNRYPDIPIISGGFVSTPIPELIFSRTGVDIICYGEADITVKELLNKMEADHDIEDIKGLYIKKGNGEYIKTPSMPRIKNLDEINIPKKAYELLPMDIYFKNSMIVEEHTKNMEGGPDLKANKEITEKTFTLISGRGCLYNCSFCYRMIKGMRNHSVEYMIAHIKYLIDTYNIKNFIFTDEAFTSYPEWISNFCLELLSNKLDIHFRAWSRADSISEKLLKKLKQAGCYWLGFGFESGSQRMLDSMNKRITVKQNIEAINLMRKSGIDFSPTIIVGMPGEDKSTIEETRKFIRDTKIDNAGVFLATPYPNASLYKYAIKKDLIKNEDKFIESLDDADKFTINLTELSDSALKKYRYLICSEIYFNKNKNALKNGTIRDWIISFINIGKRHIQDIIVVVAFNLKLEGNLKQIYRIFQKLRSI